MHDHCNSFLVLLSTQSLTRHCCAATDATATAMLQVLLCGVPAGALACAQAAVSIQGAAAKQLVLPLTQALGISHGHQAMLSLCHQWWAVAVKPLRLPAPVHYLNCSIEAGALVLDWLPAGCDPA